jgi:cytoskeletal protein RodZ
VTRTKSVNFFGTLITSMAIATLLVASGSAFGRDGQRQRAANPPRASQPHTRTTERQRTENGRTRSDTWTTASGKTATRDTERTRTDDGFTRSTTATNPDGETASRDLTVTRDKDAGTVTRESNYRTFDGREGSKSDVIQRTEDGFARDTTRTLPDGETHTRSVEVSCEKDANKCVRQVEVDQP